MKFRIFILFCFLAQLSAGGSLHAETVEVYGLEAMPFCGIVDGMPVGIAIDILNKSTQYGAPNFKFNMNIPWRRAQARIQKARKKLVAIIPFSRTKPREKKFKWIVELLRTQYHFYTYNRSAPIRTSYDARELKIGVVHGHAIIKVLKRRGFHKLDTGAKTAMINARKLKIGRTDAIADADIINLYVWKKLGYNKNELQQGPAIGEPTHVFLAAGLGFPDEVAIRISTAFQKMKQNGEMRKIINNWL